MSQISQPSSTSAATTVDFEEDQRPLPASLVLELLSGLKREDIRYCHWKSNRQIASALSGEEDLDLLVTRTDFSRFVRCLVDRGFKSAESPSSSQQPGVFHFLGHDHDSGLLINVHAYTKILTGDHLLKSWALPLNQMLLENTGNTQGIELPAPSAELITFVLRQMIKSASILDLPRAWRSRRESVDECGWLLQASDQDEVERLLGKFFPEILLSDFMDVVQLIRSDAGLWPRIRAARRMTRPLRKYRRYSFCESTIRTCLTVSRMIINKFWRSQKHMTLDAGGAIIAFVGPQATGKSTLTNAVNNWLGCELAVRVFHVGKPPATLLTWLPSKLIPLARKLIPQQRTFHVDRVVEDEPTGRFPYLYLIRKLMLAHDRRQLLRRISRETRNGRIVLCDRYPSDNPGAIDGASFRPEMLTSEHSRIKRWLMQWEGRIYQDIGPPDLVVELSVSPDVAVERNLVRHKKQPQDTDYVLQRHGMRHKPRFDLSPVEQVSTDADMSTTLAAVKRVIWKHL